MPEPSHPGAGPDPLTERLDAYLTDLEREPVPPRLAHTTLADLQATRRAPAWGGPQWVLAGAAVVAALLLLFSATRRGGDELVDTTHAPPTSAPTTGGSTSPTTTATGPAATDGPTSTAGEPGTTTSTAPAPPGSTSLPPGPSVTTTTAKAGPATTSTTKVAPTTTTPAPTTTTPTTVAGEVFFDDFSGGAGRWTTDSGSWSVMNTADGPFYGATGTGESRASAGAAWGDVTVRARFKMDPAVIRAGLGLRYQDADNYLFCKVDLPNHQLLVGRFQNGSATVLASVGHAFTASTFYDMTFRASGSSLSCSVAGATAANASDGTFGAGRIALLSDGHAGFTDVRVTVP